MDKYAIIVAGGSGLRMGTTVPKQFLLLHDKPLIWYTISAFQEAYADIKIILVLPETYIDEGGRILGSTLYPGNIQLAGGGPTRFQSVQNGLAYVPGDSIVFVHDGVRCLLTPALVHRCHDATMLLGNAVPCIPVVDSLRVETETGNHVIDRSSVRSIQTPQTFFTNVLKTAFLQDHDESFTDEAMVVERLGEKIHLVEGEATNIKITRPIDLVFAEKIISIRKLAN